MDRVIKVLTFGKAGTGKSALSNLLLNINGTSKESFPEANDSGEREALCSQCIQRTLNFDDCELNLKIVDTPGLFKGQNTSFEKSWKDMVHGFLLLKNYVSVFLITLHSQKVEDGEKVVRSFLEFFGKSAAVHCVIVFTHVPHPYKKNYERRIRFGHSKYLFDMLGDGYPSIIWNYDKEDEHVSTLMQMIQAISDDTAYTKKMFSEAQLTLADKWIKQQKNNYSKKTLKSITCKNDLRNLGIPESLPDRIFTDEESKSLVASIKNP